MSEPLDARITSSAVPSQNESESRSEDVEPRLTTLACLHHGIDIAEYGVFIPWLVTQGELYERLPSAVVPVSPEWWPRLRFTCLGVTAGFDFNFVAHPERRLVGIRFDEPVARGASRTFRNDASIIRARLGPPNTVDQPTHMAWRDSSVSVNYSVRTSERPINTRTRALGIYYHAGVPRAWVPPNETALGEVKRLLELLPGVGVVRLQCSPRGTHMDLTVGCTQSLAWLAHTMCANNVLFQVSVDWYHLSNRGTLRAEPGDIVYQVGLPGPRVAGPGESPTALQILGIDLARELRERGMLKESEATRLLELFHNQADYERGAPSPPLTGS